MRRQIAGLAREHPELFQAYGHEVRASILAMFDAGAKELSPVEIAKALGDPVTNVGYHMRILAQLGIITPTRTTPARGAVRHHYRLSS